MGGIICISELLIFLPEIFDWQEQILVLLLSCTVGSRHSSALNADSSDRCVFLSHLTDENLGLRVLGRMSEVKLQDWCFVLK